jgi:acyl-CoA thioester hydrolase
VNNAVYLNYLEYARCEFLRSINFDYKALRRAGYGVYTAKIEIEYKSPAFSDDLLIIQTWPLKKALASGIFAQQIWRESLLIVNAKITWAFVNDQGIPTKIPPEWDFQALAPPIV